MQEGIQSKGIQSRLGEKEITVNVKQLITLTAIVFLLAFSPALIFLRFAGALGSTDDLLFTGDEALINVLLILIEALIVGLLFFYTGFKLVRIGKKDDSYVGQQESEGNDNRPDGLTPREIEVLRLIASGKTDIEIADDLGMALGTENNHVRNIFRKTQTDNRTQAAAYAIRNGFGPSSSTEG